MIADEDLHRHAAFVIATGEQHSVREFVTVAARALGMTLRWSGADADEVGIVEALTGEVATGAAALGQLVVRVDRTYLRPAEVESLVGSAEKARRQLAWQPRTSFAELIEEMIAADLALAIREKASLGRGLKIYRPDLEGG